MVARQPADESTTEQLQRGRDEARRIGADIADITEELRELAALEARLAKAETKQNVSFLVRGAAWGVAAAVLAILMLAFAFTTVMLVLNIWLQSWASALITTGIVLLLTIAAGSLAHRAFQKFSVTPQRTMDSLKEDMRWLKSQLTSNGR